MITIYENIKEIKDGKYITIDTALNRIKEGNSKAKVYLIQGTKDKKERSKIKATLPSVCFSGTFKTRKDSDLIEHSGFVVLDFDGVRNLDKKKKEICEDEYTYACWVSPSGNGLKALIQIPKDKDKHENYYLALIDKYPELDTTSKNLSRVCYESYDGDIYINKDSKIWDKEREDYQKKEIVEIKATKTNYHKVENVLNIVRNSIEGEKHKELLKASRLAGGFIAGGFVSESEIVRLLESEIVSKGIDDEQAAFKVIQKGIDYGKNDPIVDEFVDNYIQKKEEPKIIIKDDFLSTKEKESNWLLMARENRIPQGYDMGSEHFDNHYRLKKKTMVGIFGIDNVGKTTFKNFMDVAYAKRHGVNSLYVCRENEAQSIRQNIVELYSGKPLHEQSKGDYDEGLNFSYEKFDLISNVFDVNMDNFFKVVEKAYSNKHYFSTFIDPYNAIQFNQTPDKNYHFLGKLREYQNQLDMSFHISMHISTDKARNFVYSEKDSITTFDGQELSVKGEMKLPRKNFVEGGQPIANKLDDIIIVHRLPKVSELRNYTLISVDKVKEDKTGGMQSFEEPIMFKKTYPYDSFFDANNINPISREKLEVKPFDPLAFVEPNLDFDSIDSPF